MAIYAASQAPKCQVPRCSREGYLCREKGGPTSVQLPSVAFWQRFRSSHMHSSLRYVELIFDTCRAGVGYQRQVPRATGHFLTILPKVCCKPSQLLIAAGAISMIFCLLQTTWSPKEATRTLTRMTNDNKPARTAAPASATLLVFLYSMLTRIQTQC